MFPSSFPPQVRGCSLYLIFHPYLGTRRSELYSCLSPPGTVEGLQLFTSNRHLNLDTPNSTQCQQKLMSWTGASPWSSSNSHSNPPQRQGSCLSCLQPFQSFVHGHAACPWLPISTSASPFPYHPAFHGQEVPSLSCTSLVCLTLLPLQFSHLLQTTIDTYIILKSLLQGSSAILTR